MILGNVELKPCPRSKWPIYQAHDVFQKGERSNQGGRAKLGGESGAGKLEPPLIYIFYYLKRGNAETMGKVLNPYHPSKQKTLRNQNKQTAGKAEIMDLPADRTFPHYYHLLFGNSISRNEE